MFRKVSIRLVPGYASSKLSNGLTVVTYDDHSPASGLALYARSGSCYERTGTEGASAILESVVYRGTKGKSDADMALDIAKLGASLRVDHQRETFGWILSAPRYSLDDAISILSHVALSPPLNPPVFEDAREHMKDHIETQVGDATQICFDLVHEATFEQPGLGCPLHPPVDKLQLLQPEVVRVFHSATVQPSRCVVVGSSLCESHDAFCTRLECLLHFPAPPNVTGSDSTCSFDLRPPSPYKGGYVGRFSSDALGSITKFAEHNHTHIFAALGGIPFDHPDYYAYSLLQTLLGGGTSFSSGGPGKGLHTKLFREVLGTAPWIHGIECVTAWYSTTGLFGLYGQAPHDHARRLSFTVLAQLATIAERIGESHVEMARNQLISQLVLLAEGREMRLEETGKHFCLHSVSHTPLQIMEGAQSVTLEDIRRICHDMMQTPLTFVVFGNTEITPTYQEASDILNQLYQKHSTK